MVETTELVIIWAVIATIVLVVLMVVLGKNQRKFLDLQQKYEKKQTRSYKLGENALRGTINEILAGFAILNEYKQLALLSSVSKQFSIDLLGIKDDSIDFIEVKTKGTPLTPTEKNVQQLITDKKVNYRIIEGDFPDFQVNDRDT